MTKKTPTPSLNFLFGITLVNYLAQVPYYLHNYYFRYHIPPSLSSILLLGLTLGWFLMGYGGFKNGYFFGYPLLISFLLFEALFYLYSFLFGAFFFQIQNPSLIIKAVFLIGYVSGAAAGYYAYLLIRGKYKKTEL